MGVVGFEGQPSFCTPWGREQTVNFEKEKIDYWRCRLEEGVELGYLLAKLAEEPLIKL
jgi:hypothetical protein